MAGRVLSIEIGYSYIKVCEMDYQAKKTKVYNSFVLSTPEGVMADGMLTVDDRLLSLFRSRLAEKRVKAKSVVFTISSSRIVTREVRIPYCKENRIGDLIQANLSDYFPIDASQYMIAHTILGVENSPEGKPTGYRLLLIAAPTQILDGYRKLATALNLDLKEIDYNGNSIYQAAKESCSDGTQMIVKIDERSSLLLVLDDGVIKLNRTIPYGIDQAAIALSRTLAWGPLRSYENAMDLAMRKTCILPYLSVTEGNANPFDDSDDSFEEGQWEEETEAVLKDKREVTEALIPLINNIQKVIDYYNANHSGATIEKIYITGIGSDFRGTAKLLSNEIGYRVRKLKNITGISIDKTFSRGSAYGEYVACIGAGMSPVHFTSGSGDVKGKARAKGGSKEAKSSSASGDSALKVSIAVCAVCVVASIVLVLITIFPYMSAKNQNTEYKAEIDRLKPVYQVYIDHQTVLGKVTKMRAMEAATVNRNKDLVEFIETLEKNMPATFYLNGLTAETSGISMSVTVGSKEEVAAVLDELQKLPAFTVVDTTSVSESESEIGELRYTFAVAMVYAPIVTEPEAQEGGE